MTAEDRPTDDDLDRARWHLAHMMWGMALDGPDAPHWDTFMRAAQCYLKHEGWTPASGHYWDEKETYRCRPARADCSPGQDDCHDGACRACARCCDTLAAQVEALREALQALNSGRSSVGGLLSALRRVLDSAPTDALSELRRRVLEEAAADLEAGISRNRGGQHVGVTGLHPEFATQRGVLDAVRWLRTRALTTKETDQ